MPRLDEYFRIKEAAEYLGVSQNTLRNWGASGKLPMHRNPVNGYRLFKITDLDQFLLQVEQSSKRRRFPK